MKARRAAIRWSPASLSIAASTICGVMLLTGACSSSSSRDNGSPSISQNSATVQPLSAAPPSPIDDCDGVTTYASALDLVMGGRATVLVSAKVQASPQKISGSAIYTLSSVSVLAGHDDDIRSVALSFAGGGNPLPEGQYLLLLGEADPTHGIYYLANGLKGSFTTSGDRATQRCPNYVDANQPSLATSSVDESDLVSYFDEALTYRSKLSLSPTSTNDPSQTVPSDTSEQTSTGEPSAASSSSTS